LGDNAAVDTNDRGAVVVQAVTVAALLVGVEVDAAALRVMLSLFLWKIWVLYYLFGGLSHQLDSRIELP
jgi:type IV secretory pathway VirB3-like protein